MSVLHQDSGGIEKSIASNLQNYLGSGFCNPKKPTTSGNLPREVSRALGMDFSVHYVKSTNNSLDCQDFEYACYSLSCQLMVPQGLNVCGPHVLPQVTPLPHLAWHKS